LFYIHIPFCDSKCHYCAFNSYTDLFHLQNAYLKALLIQIKEDIERENIAQHSITSLFIGGGTPSTYAAHHYEVILDLIFPYLIKDAEITIEANPNSATKEWLKGVFSLGINRISFGTQSFDDAKLKLLGRAHCAKEAINAIDNASHVGFEHISFDFIYGTKYDTNAFITQELSLINTLPIDHVSSYNLIIEEGTPFAKNPNFRIEREENYHHVKNIIEGFDLPQYEVSNFGRYQSKHNQGYWEGKDYLGLGAGAVGTIHNKRIYTHKNLNDYIQNPLHKEIEHLSDEDKRIERILLGLRSNIGFNLSELKKEEEKKLLILKKENKIVIQKERVKANDLFLADELALFMTR
jgi:oxygen-independent coproporphyrinogen III oxidase